MPDAATDLPDPDGHVGTDVHIDVDAARAGLLAVRSEVARVVVGQDGTVSGAITALLVGGHVLLEGVPGVAKTLLAKALAGALGLSFNRIQFTPDLMPSDVTGQVVYDAARGAFEFRPGPVFANVVLADEVNRTPPKTQAALLEAMEENQVSVAGVGHPLPDPFVVLATQNPVEYEGTYPLPEAQLDRFLVKLEMGYPSVDQEREILARHDRGPSPHEVAASLVPVAGAAELSAARQGAASVRVEDAVRAYVVDVARATRESPSVALGVSPRGAAMLLRAAKAWAWLIERPFVTPDEVKAMALPVLRHRIVLRPELELEGMRADAVIDSVLATVPVPRSRCDPSRPVGWRWSRRRRRWWQRWLRWVAGGPCSCSTARSWWRPSSTWPEPRTRLGSASSARCRAWSPWAAPRR